MWWLKQLFKPLNYLRINVSKDGKWLQGKKIYDLLLPLGIAIFTTIVFWFVRNHSSITGTEGIMADIKGLVQLLTAFFIAALAAVSTFPNDTLDEGLSGSPALLKVSNQSEPTTLTRRQFVCYLFGYLSLMSILTFLFISISQGLSEELRELIKYLIPSQHISLVIDSVRTFGIFIFSLIIGNLLITTLLGLYFLTSGFHKIEE
ncbi:hypothetical protein [Kiloniella majae]|uniref:hypothetical protein n=1 Tax=Kiloniella majae TaxID=1938558 RepID=UPI000A2776AC|nr:hypothetical protein [Kiloniella majae]